MRQKQHGGAKWSNVLRIAFNQRTHAKFIGRCKINGRFAYLNYISYDATCSLIDTVSAAFCKWIVNAINMASSPAQSTLATFGENAISAI